MGIPGAYLKQGRVNHGLRDAKDAVRDFDEYAVKLDLDAQEAQAARCMACGVAFCQSGVVFSGARRATGCPLHNLIPETNDLLCRGRIAQAAERLSMTNPFPEFTSRVCPAPCETACNLGLHDEPVAIRDDERAIADFLDDEGLRAPLPPAPDDAPLASVVGSGPAGLACAWELARTGWRVNVYEKADRPGGLLMYGIPAMKLPKDVVERRVELMRKSGIEFSCGVDATERAGDILATSDAVVLSCGAGHARELKVPGTDLDGVYYAMEYLTVATKAVLNGGGPQVTAKDKDVVVVGGGDTGVDCVATALRQGARSVTQVIRAARPADTADVLAAWPGPRAVWEQGYGQREAAEIFGEDPRVWGVDTLAFEGEGEVSGVRIVDFAADGSRAHVEGSERVVDAQLVLVAKGFTGPEAGLLAAFGVETAAEGPALPIVHRGTHRAHVVGDDATPVYVAGDARTGASIVASAIADGLEVAQELNASR